MKTRVISAIFMIAIILPLLIIGGLPFKILSILLAVLGMYELMKIRATKKELPIYMRLISYAFIIIFIAFGNNYYTTPNSISYKIPIILLLLFLIPVVFINDNKKYNISDAFFLLAGTFFISVSFNTFVLISDIDVKYILYLILITVMTDTFAYFGGSLIGKHKLCKDISPNKTIEGAIVGSVVGVIVPALFYLYVINNSVNILTVIIVTFILSVVGQIGDLMFSSIKRYYGVKDFSNLIPGHGGILDRFDSIIFVVLTYILFMNIL